jgi:hypothetical protein
MQLHHDKSLRARSRRMLVCNRLVLLTRTSLHLLTQTQEFDRLQDGETIYKLSGPVLLKQDKFEAENTVKGRLDFIGSEM